MKNILSRSTLLLVDDTPHNIDFLINTIGNTYNLIIATNGEDALAAADESVPDLILLDILMPGMDGFEVCTRLKQNKKTCEIPVIFLSAVTEVDQKTRGFSLGAADYITKPFNVQEVSARVETHLAAKFARDCLMNQNNILENIVRERTSEIMATQDITIRMAASLAETRDNDTGNHIIRTQMYVKKLAEKLSMESKYRSQLDDKTIDLLVKSSPLHDIGKIGVTDRVLLKPGRLDDNEFTEMKMHTVFGYNALLKAEKEMKSDSFLTISREIAYTHHEKWNGTGYPQGLKGEDIPLSGRIMAVADVYDALVTRRIYKPPVSHDEAVSIMCEGRGTHFDPVLTDCFLQINGEFRTIAVALSEADDIKNDL